MFQWKVLHQVRFVFSFLIILCVSEVYAVDFNIERGDILVWEEKYRSPLITPLDALAHWIHPELMWRTHVDIAGEDYCGDDTIMVTATRKRVGDLERFGDRRKMFGAFTVLRTKHPLRIESAMAKTLLTQGSFSDLEGILVGLDILTSGGKRVIFRRFSRASRYTCISFVAYCYDIQLPHLVLPNDLFLVYHLERVEYYILP